MTDQFVQEYALIATGNRQTYLSQLKDHRPALADFIARAERKQLEQVDLAALLRRAHSLCVISSGYGYPQIGLVAQSVEQALIASDMHEMLLRQVRLLRRLCHEALVFLPERAPGAASRPIPAAGTKLPILLAADDDRAVRALVESLFEPYARVLSAADGLAALEMVQHYRPDLLLLDDTMPGMTGMRLLDRLNQDDIIYKPKIVMLTSSDRPQDIARARGAGAIEYILKPFAPDSLLDKILALLPPQGEGA